jgi:hypothetical protein
VGAAIRTPTTSPVRALIALDHPDAVGGRIDLGMDRPISAADAADVFGQLLNRETKVRSLPWPIMSAAAIFNPFLRDGAAMID